MTDQTCTRIGLHRDTTAATECSGQWEWVLAAPFRAHVRELLDGAETTWQVLACFAELPDELVRRLAGPRRSCPRRIPPEYARRLLQISRAGLQRGLGAQVRGVQADRYWRLLTRHGVGAAGRRPARLPGSQEVGWVSLAEELRLQALCRAVGLGPMIETTESELHREPVPAAQLHTLHHPTRLHPARRPTGQLHAA